MGIDLKSDERRGEEARAILQNELYKESWTAMRENIVAKLEQGSLTEEQRKMWNDLLIVHGKAKKYLENVLTTGTMAAMEMEKQRTILEKAQATTGDWYKRIKEKRYG